MGGILSSYTDDKELTCCQDCVTNECNNGCTNCDNCEDLKLKVEYLESFCKNLENRILNLEKGRRTILL